MKRIAIYILMALVLPFVSCQKDLVPDPGQEQDLEGIVLTMKCQEPELSSRAGTHGTKPGIAAWNENKLRVLDIYFYRDGATGSNAVKHVRHLSGADNSVTVPVNVTDVDIENIAPRAVTNHFIVYVLANYPDTTELNNLTNTSLTHLKELSLNTDFVSNHLQNSFVMDGEIQASIESRTRRLVARAEVMLKRVAAKITVHINIPDTIAVQHVIVAGEDTAIVTEHWKPALNEMKVYLVNGVRNAVVGATPLDNPTYFTYRNNMLTFSRSSAPEDTAYVWVCDPMYMYPQHWEFGSETSPEMEPTLKLQLPWTRVPENGLAEVKKQFYYKILVPNDARGGDYLRSFVRNNWYKFKIDIGILGSETDEASINLSGHYYVEEWQDKEVVIKHAEIGHARYLSVEQDEFELNNEIQLEFLYTSSHPVILKNIVVTKPYYGKSATYNDGVGNLTVRTDNAGTYYTAGTKYIQYDSTARANRNGGKDWLKVEGSHVLFTHSLNNDITSNGFDTSPYTITFSIFHKDQASNASTAYQRQITIIQYPALRIVSEANADANNNKKGYVYINNSNTSGGQGTYNYISGNLSLNSTSTSDNNNPNMYVITTSVLSMESSFILADPRSSVIDNNFGNANNNWSATATAIEGGTRRLSYYRPASTDAGSQFLIAPSFRVASSYGKLQGAITYEEAQRRCAAYQESGFPAGRWRLPTRAEIEFMITLSEKGHIPQLFTPDSALSKGGYWCSYGVVYPLTDGTIRYLEPSDASQYNSNKNWPRCVYDDWYWGKGTVDVTTFTWGDAE
ncbi:MAG: hypothetical protein K6D54_02285 [Bacteroidales bacterium]|nr:hypothetical protein [Bacteroidales bacterium]